MPGQKELTLTAEERRELEALRDTHELPYLRERAAALLKIADGVSGRQVALNGLLKSRRPDTIYEWVRRWQNEGLQGLFIRKGRGRKPAFSPSAHHRGGGP
jgi:transposase